jgi:hypothetical protein
MALLIPNAYNADMDELDDFDAILLDNHAHTNSVNITFQKAIDALLDPSLCDNIPEARVELQQMSQAGLASFSDKGNDARRLEQKMLKTEELQVLFMRVLFTPGTLQLLTNESLRHIIKVTEHYLVKSPSTLTDKESHDFYGALLRFFMKMTDAKKTLRYDTKKKFEWKFTITDSAAKEISARFRALHKKSQGLISILEARGKPKFKDLMY